MKQTTGNTALYCRLACRVRGDDAVIEYQRMALRSFAEKHGFGNIVEYQDYGYGGHNLDRPALTQMLADIKAGEIGTVIVKNVDRLARGGGDTALTRVFEEAGVKLISTTAISDDTPPGILLHSIMDAIAKFYSNELAAEAN